ncbi:UDP-N-acetylglucosamine transferase subunit ALG14 [Yarrowia lipolytica]|jgi:beta-1,4-N-acetylglucosaminyltransferase|uniref:UDP-N-acetylglucosamine transferase subunit ALG14 n=2 Tax=Yarrowia lipolytica TaxID=4952 RepID=ALG14_YARLI|nr:YALI0B11440p [Yarrowia lipolytica CLIB122]Q6CF02.1 RecName: Full=UDP-N-acetylglucosamine transferase subunit ALG14; AltName: Full=Asparagine-linked glycosylation protein 14 [Yarrowia lipolytica CLIB122]AOW01551.1 hypothetical protein YALI1_B15180g [Yarrowia lipolytica]KAB8280035.1 UDP-N-acetylglucosamine transferase subunit ALG14 [Yarrowia lipolytica]KAE8169022.1 UDP-N-acetylglucosamine transferase subunit ALG14 [Yarrowia lipolytica]KAJ8052367.1 UDP-N-acetylglucosamine transferase subunit A|eukprot:XP_500760.1 YALI0B11440p [Yarrowia lipolytica CLIB122]
MVTTILIAASAILVLLLLRLLFVLPASNRFGFLYRPKHSNPKLMVMMGSGGHTGEMLRMLKTLKLQSYAKRVYVSSSGDVDSLEKVKVLESTTKTDIKTMVLENIPRARKVGQSYPSSVITSAVSFAVAVKLVHKHKPHVIVCNGPATCVMLCYAAFLLRFMALIDTRIIYVESLARVNRLSLSGLILLPFCDRFLVQWPQLAEKYPRAEYHGILV